MGGSASTADASRDKRQRARATHQQQQSAGRGRAALQVVRNEVLPAAIFFSVTAATLKWALGQLDPNKDAKRAGRLRGERLSKRLGRRVELQDLEQVRKQPSHSHRGRRQNTRCCSGCRHCIEEEGR